MFEIQSTQINKINIEDKCYNFLLEMMQKYSQEFELDFEENCALKSA
jgi:hypothetical protein